MKNNEKSREPFDPENTPEPPQVSHPLSRKKDEKAGKKKSMEKDPSSKNKKRKRS